MKKIILGIVMLGSAMPVLAADKVEKVEIVEKVEKVEKVEVAAKAPLFMPPSTKMKPATSAAKAVAVVPAAPAAAPVAAVSEAQTKLQAIKKQEEWVAKLTKQLEAEKNQLKEMREGYAQAFGKEPK